MADATHVQTDFLGGEWSPYAQGRLDDPEYKRGMNVCRNLHPVETGAAVRRAGTRSWGFTRCGAPAKKFPFSFAQNAPYNIELTDGKLRLLTPQGLVMAEYPRVVTNIDGNTPALVTTFAATDSWNSGDTVIFEFPAQGTPDAARALVGRQFQIQAGVDDEHWLLYDAVTGQPVNGGEVNWDASVGTQCSRVFELDTPYINGAWQSVRIVQDEDSVLMLHPSIPSYSLFAAVDGGNLFTLTLAQFIDGPYLDPAGDGAILTPSAQSGQITLTLSYPAWSSTVPYPNGSRFFAATNKRAGTNTTDPGYVNGSVVSRSGQNYVSIKDGNINNDPASSPTWWQSVGTANAVGPMGFQASDVGRSIRVCSEPALWNSATGYAIGNIVAYLPGGGIGDQTTGVTYYSALTANTNVVPGVDATNWGVASNASNWTWAIITAVNSSVQVTAQLQGTDGGNLLYDLPIRTWRLGTYSNTTSWPACGTFHEGRFWLGGAVKNRFDASKSDGNTYDFGPTYFDGTVSDDNAISETFTSPQQNQLLWMEPDHQGIIMGTAQGEWLVQSSANNDPITPTSIQGHNVTKYGCANVEPVRAGVSLAFVQRYGNKLMEYVCDLFSSKFAALNLSAKAKHLTGAGIKRIAYQQELIPIIWAVTNDGNLIGTTYKRESMMVSQPPNFNGWHRHDLGSDFKVIDMCSSASPSGLLDSISLVTQDPVTGWCYNEVLTEFFDETSTINDAWFLDCAVTPSGAEQVTINSILGVEFIGLGHLEGKLVSAFIAGLDLGDYTVTDGTIFVPYQSDPGKLFTLAYVQNLSSTISTDYGVVIQVPQTAFVQSMLQFPPLPDLTHVTYLNYGTSLLPDWKRDRVTFLLPGTGPLSGLVQYTISTGALVKYQKSQDIWGLPNPPYYDPTVTYGASPRVLASNGTIWTLQSQSSFNVNPLTSGQRDWIEQGNPTTVPANYSSGTTYNLGDYTLASDGFIYKSLIGSNTGNNPLTSPSDWQQQWKPPSAWSASTKYVVTGITVVTGDDDEIFYSTQVVPAGAGDPNSFPRNNNPYWITSGFPYPYNITSSGLGLDFNGDIYMYEGGNFGPYVKINGTTLTTSAFASTNQQSGITIPAPSGGTIPMRVLNNDGTAQDDFIVACSNTTPAGGGTVCAIIMSSASLIVSSAATIDFDEGATAIACPATVGYGSGSFFAMTVRGSGNSPQFSFGLYEVAASGQAPATPAKAQRPYAPFAAVAHSQVDPGGGTIATRQDPNAGIVGNQAQQAFTRRKIGTVSPAQIDPTWTFLAGQTGLIFDQADGNMMTFVQTQNPSAWNSATTYGDSGNLNDAVVGSDGQVYASKVVSNINNNPVGDVGVHWTLLNTATATNMQYFIKMRAADASILWTIPVFSTPTTGDMLSQSNIVDGVFIWNENVSAGAFQGHYVETVSGHNSIFAAAGINTLGTGYAYNSLTSQGIMYPQYDSTQPGSPSPIGGTPASFTGWGIWTVTRPFKPYTVPGVVGFTYTSQGQLLRPVSPQDSGARNGPAFGKTRRNHRYAMSVANTQGCAIGTTFNATHPAVFKSGSGTGVKPLTQNQLYTGEHTDTVTDDYSLDGMLCWQTTRPLPTVMLALGGFLQTQDR